MSVTCLMRTNRVNTAKKKKKKKKIRSECSIREFVVAGNETCCARPAPVSLHFNAVWGADRWDSRWSCRLRRPHPLSVVLWVLAFHLYFISLLRHLRNSGDFPKCLKPCLHVGDAEDAPGCSLPRPGHCGHWWRAPVSGRPGSLNLSLSVFPPLFAFQTTKPLFLLLLF